MGTITIPAETESMAPRIWNAALRSLLLAASALFLLNLNPFETPSVSKRLSQDLIYAVFGNQSWLYPRRIDTTAHGHLHPPVVVVMVDEAALALRDAHWPVPIGFHAEFLAELEVLKPRAIMLDFLLLDRAPPEDTCALLAVASELHANGTRLYLAVTRREDLQLLDAAGCRDAAGQPLVAASLLTPVSVNRLADATDFVNRLYPFEVADRADVPASGLVSAAVRMYCDSTPAPAACIRRMTDYDAPEAGFDLAWSPSGDPFNQRWSHGACTEIRSPSRAILDHQMLPGDNPCPPVPTLFASALLDPAVDPTLGASNEQLFELLDGAFVFVGGNFRGSGDLMSTPMHRLLPGVYYHAVALENLIAFDGHPKIRKEFRHATVGYYLYDLAVLWGLAAMFLWREHLLTRGQAHLHHPLELSPRTWLWLVKVTARVPTSVWVIGFAMVLVLLASFKGLQLSALAAAAVVLIAMELRIASAADIRERLRRIGLTLATLAVSLLFIAAAIWVGYRWLTLPPGDWIGYISFTAVGFFVTHAGILEFERRVSKRRIAHHSSGDLT